MRSVLDKEWTDEEFAAVAKLWDDGVSGAEIGRRFHRTRSGVIAKITRMRARGYPFKRAAVPMAARSEKAKSQRDNRQPQRRMSTALRRPSSPPKPLPEPPAIVDATHAKPWGERKAGECAFPISGDGEATLSCCTPTTARYCKAHAEIMYAPPKAPRTEAQAAGDVRRQLKAIQRFAARAA